MNSDFPFFFRSRPDRILVLFFTAMLLLTTASEWFGQEGSDEADQAVTLFNDGQNAHEKGDLPAAIKLYQKALETIPKFPEAELQLGNAFLTLGQIDKAEKSFRRAVEHKEDWSLALASLGSVLVTRSAFAEAEQVLTKAIKLDELNFPAYSALTELRLKTKAGPELLADLLGKLKMLTSKAKPTASIWAARSALEFAEGDLGAAKSSAAKALEIDAKNRSALLSLASIALAENDMTEAGAIAASLEALAPDSTNVKILRARIFYDTGNSAAAIKLLNSIEDPSADVSALRDKILVNTSQSTVELERQLEKDAASPLILGRLCSVLRIENPAKALDFCRRASEAEPANLSHAIGYGAALVQAKLYIEAVTLLRRILKIAPDNSTVRANLATALFQLKNYPEAKIEYQWLVEKQPKLAIAYYFLGIAHDQLGEYLDAMANYQQFLRVADPETSKLEIEKVTLRMPELEKQIKDKKGKRNGK
ncbi:MAG: tetratricopeptide repeat protein [Saprospiraceae bacterium]|nr:tetratricopeptide repeat protein [Pyrinomonadaceae bacterium]